jgi:hypothetical protein
MNIKEALKKLTTAEKQPLPVLIVAVVIGLSVVLSFPLLLIYGIKFIGFEGVDLTLRSYIGAIMILFFLSYASRMGSSKDN